MTSKQWDTTKHGLWTGLNWTGLDWTGLDWTGLNCFGLKIGEKIRELLTTPTFTRCYHVAGAMAEHEYTRGNRKHSHSASIDSASEVIVVSSDSDSESPPPVFTPTKRKSSPLAFSSDSRYMYGWH